MNFSPLLDFHWASWLLWALVVTQLTIFCVTVYLHRAQAHRALDVHPGLGHVIRFWLWLTTGMSTQQWVAVHRKHHAHCETEQDPHSPQVLGLKKVFFLGARLYAKEARNPQTVARYATGAPNDWMERTLYTRGSTWGPVSLVLLNWAVWGWGAGTSMSAVQLLWVPLWAAGVINGIGHFKGYRNFDCSDASRNLVPWGLWIGGEELHNNHHAHPTSAKLSYHWWEVDIGWGVIRVLQALGLAKVKKAMRAPKVGAPHQSVGQTWQAAVQFRGQLERWFAQAWAAEARRAAGTPEQRKRWMLARAQVLQATPARLTATQPQVALPSSLAQLQAQWRQLQALWNEKGLSQEQALKALSSWLEQAQQSSLASVQRIAWRMQRLA